MSAPAALLSAFTGAAFPTIVSNNTTIQETVSTAHAVPLPGSYAAGDLLIVIFAWYGNATATTPSGWTLLGSRVDPGGTNRVTFTVYYKTATGSEGSTVSITTNAGIHSAQVALSIRGWSGTPEMAAENYGGTGATGNTSDPPALTPSWGALNTLWIAVGANVNATISSGPTGYSDFTAIETTTHTTTDASVASAWKQSSAASEDPSSFGLDATVFRCAATIAVKPA
jgi:hypothetical protein